MPKWEYVEEVFKVYDKEDEDKLWDIVPSSKKATEKYGEEGWELVSVVPIWKETYFRQHICTSALWIFKRQIE